MAGPTSKRRGRPPKAAPAPAAPPTAPKAEPAVPPTPPPPQPRKAATDVWMYREYDARLFKAGETIPDDYVDSPAKVTR